MAIKTFVAVVTGCKLVAGLRDEDEFRDILIINSLGPFLVIKAFLALIRKGSKKQVRASSDRQNK